MNLENTNNIHVNKPGEESKDIIPKDNKERPVEKQCI